jgi:hypothetical protein
LSISGIAIKENKVFKNILVPVPKGLYREFHYRAVTMKLTAIRGLMIGSVIICWIVIALNIYSLAFGNSLLSLDIGPTGAISSAEKANLESGGSLGYDDNRSIVEQLLSDRAPERPSPCQRINQSQIFVTEGSILIDFQNAEWAKFTDTNSMDPVLDTGSYALEYVPLSPEELCVGDIASYRTRLADGTIIHRIVEIGYDQEGWYAKFKGDNLPYIDPERVRFEQIQRVVIGIIY